MAPFKKFQDRVAVLTGGASGIGRELLHQLIRRGTHVAVCDIDRDGLDAAVRRARAINPDVRVTAHLHDVADEKSVVRFAKDVARQHGHAIHLLFNNAGIVGGASFVVGQRDEWERTFAVSWFGTYYSPGLYGVASRRSPRPRAPCLCRAGHAGACPDRNACPSTVMAPSAQLAVR